MAFTNQNDIVIGGAGFIGSHVVERLAQDRVIRVTPVDNFNIDQSTAVKRQREQVLASHYNLKVRSNHRDMCITVKLSARLSEHAYTHVVLLAPPTADITVTKITAHERDIHHKKAKECFTAVLDAIVQAGTHHGTIPKLVFALPALSRSEELDSAELHERELRLHHSLLDLAQLYHARHGLVSVGLRLTDVYGPGDNPGSDVYRYASQAMRGVPIVLSAQQAKKQYHFTYIDDVVEGIISAMNYPATSPTAFELSSNVTLNVGDILGAVAFRGRKNITLATPNDLLINSSSDLPVHSPTPSSKHFLDKERFSCAHMELGFQASVGFKSGMGRFMEWFRRTESRVFPCASECATPRLCFRSTWDSVAETSKELTQGCQNVFYTVAIDGTVDGLHVLPKFYEDQSLTCNIAFVTRDSPLVKSTIANTDERISTKYHSYGNWTMVLVDEFTSFSDPRKPTRVPKLSPGKFFASTVQHAVYMDSKLLLTSDPREFIGMTQADYPGNKGHGIALLAIHINDGLFAHIDHVLERSVDRPSITFYYSVLKQQKRAYLEYRDQYPGMRFMNLFDGAFIIHNMQAGIARDFRCDWYKEYQQWSDRDQVAASFILTKRSFQMRSAAAFTGSQELIKIGRDPKVLRSQRFFLYFISADDGIVRQVQQQSNEVTVLHSMMENGETTFFVGDYQQQQGMRLMESGSQSSLVWSLHSQEGAELVKPQQAEAGTELNASVSPEAKVGLDARGEKAGDGVWCVRLLSRQEYHWAPNKNRVGRLEYFSWNRWGAWCVYVNTLLPFHQGNNINIIQPLLT